MSRATSPRPRASGGLPWIAFALIALSVLWWLLPIGHWIETLAGRLRDGGAAGAALFMAVYIAAEITVMPGAPLALAAGYAYGPLVGLLVVWPAAVVSATLAFLLARTLLREPVERMVRKRLQKRVKGRLGRSVAVRGLNSAAGDNSLKLMLLLRLSPIVPFNLLNYALGLSDVSMGRYVLATAIGIVPGTWMYVYLGSLAPAAVALREAGRQPSAVRVVWIALGLVATVAGVVLLAVAARKALATADGSLPRR